MLFLHLLVEMALPKLNPVPRQFAGLTRDARQQSELEHIDAVLVDDGRGRILYRNGLPWTGQWRRRNWPAGSSSYVAMHSDLEDGHRNPLVGLTGLPDVWPDPARRVAEQGRSGLELSFDRQLSPIRPGFVGQLTAADGRAVPKRYFSVHAIHGSDVETTIDDYLQQKLEQVMPASIHRGAVVVLSVRNRQVLAMVDRDDKHRMSLPALTPEAPGSVFKLFTAAAALESFAFRPSSPFLCTGVVPERGVRMSCWRVHGRENFLDALSASCDVAFAQIGCRLGRQAFVEMNRRLSLTGTGLQTVYGQSVLQEAKPGRIFARPGSDNGLLANTAIGQEDVRISPLQAANLAAVIASGGIVQDASLVKGLMRDGKTVASFPTSRARRGMSSYTASELAYAMHRAAVWPSGTAFGLGVGQDLAVKTGTAELPQRGNVNSWMVGFYPYHHPEIAFAVFVGNAPSGAAHRATRHITASLIRAYRQIQPSGVIS